jgi:hypothetical protein
MIVLSFVVPTLVERSTLEKVTRKNEADAPGFEGWGADAPELLPAFMTGQIVRLAMLEGAAFLNLIAYMLEGKALSLAAAAVLVLLMIAAYPTEGRVRGWLERIREETSPTPGP